MAFDSVASDATGLAFVKKVQPESQSLEALAQTWLKVAAEMKLGTNDPAKIDFVEQSIG